MLNLRRPALLAILTVALAVSACGASATPAPSAGASASATAGPPAATHTLVTIVMRGGECPAATCEQTVTVEQGGRVRIAAKPPNVLGQIGPVELLALQTAITGTDFNALRAHRFTGMCPTAVDGQELVLTFSTAKGDQRLAACETQLDFSWPVLAALASALGPIWPLPIAK